MTAWGNIKSTQIGIIKLKQNIKKILVNPLFSFTFKYVVCLMDGNKVPSPAHSWPVDPYHITVVIY